MHLHSALFCNDVICPPGNCIYNALFCNDVIQAESHKLFEQINREGRGQHSNDMSNMNSVLLVKDLVPFFLHHNLDLSHLKQYSVAFRCAEGQYALIDPNKIEVGWFFQRGGVEVFFVCSFRYDHFWIQCRGCGIIGSVMAGSCFEDVLPASKIFEKIPPPRLDQHQHDKMSRIQEPPPPN